MSFAWQYPLTPVHSDQGDDFTTVKNSGYVLVDHFFGAQVIANQETVDNSATATPSLAEAISESVTNSATNYPNIEQTEDANNTGTGTPSLNEQIAETLTNSAQSTQNLAGEGENLDNSAESTQTIAEAIGIVEAVTNSQSSTQTIDNKISESPRNTGVNIPWIDEPSATEADIWQVQTNTPSLFTVETTVIYTTALARQVLIPESTAEFAQQSQTNTPTIAEADVVGVSDTLTNSQTSTQTIGAYIYEIVSCSQESTQSITEQMSDTLTNTCTATIAILEQPDQYDQAYWIGTSTQTISESISESVRSSQTNTPSITPFPTSETVDNSEYSEQIIVEFIGGATFEIILNRGTSTNTLPTQSIRETVRNGVGADLDFTDSTRILGTLPTSINDTVVFFDDGSYPDTLFDFYDVNSVDSTITAVQGVGTTFLSDMGSFYDSGVYLVSIEDELFIITVVAGSTTVTINARAVAGTIAAAHDTNDDMYIKPNPIEYVTLTSTITAGATVGSTFTVNDARDFPEGITFYVQIDNEVLGVKKNTNMQLEIVSRAMNSTSAAQHDVNDLIYWLSPWDYVVFGEFYETPGYIRIGDEIMVVIMANDEQIWVIRGAFGTTPAAHTVGDPVYIPADNFDSSGEPTGENEPGIIPGTEDYPDIQGSGVSLETIFFRAKMGAELSGGAVVV